MREEFRRLGLKFYLKGVRTLEKLVNGELTVEGMSDKEVNDVLDAWDARKYIPEKELKRAISSKPGHVTGETEEQYKRRHVKKIVDVIQNLKNYPA